MTRQALLLLPVLLASGAIAIYLRTAMQRKKARGLLEKQDKSRWEDEGGATRSDTRGK